MSSSSIVEVKDKNKGFGERLLKVFEENGEYLHVLEDKWSTTMDFVFFAARRLVSTYKTVLAYKSVLVFTTTMREAECFYKTCVEAEKERDPNVEFLDMVEGKKYETVERKMTFVEINPDTCRGMSISKDLNCVFLYFPVLSDINVKEFLNVVAPVVQQDSVHAYLYYRWKK